MDLFSSFLGGVLGTVGTFSWLDDSWGPKGDMGVQTSNLWIPFFYYFTVLSCTICGTLFSIFHFLSLGSFVISARHCQMSLVYCIVHVRALPLGLAGWQ